MFRSVLQHGVGKQNPAHKPSMTSTARPSSKFKCVAIDLDNTLWPGVLAEGEACAKRAGWGKDGAPEHPCAALQQILLRLQQRGVLLLTCSRNDEQTVLSVWPRTCRLQPEHFVCHLFGWGSTKSARLGAAAAAIGVAHTSLVFVDDSPLERAEVEQALPGVRVMGASLEEAAHELSEHPILKVAKQELTHDTLTRTEKTRAVLARARAAAAAGYIAGISSESPNTLTAEQVDIMGIEVWSGHQRHSAKADKRRRKAASKAGAQQRVPGTGGGFATTGGYPKAFLRSLELRLKVRSVTLDDASRPRVCNLLQPLQHQL